MNKIIGLLKKDFLELKAYTKNFLVSLIIYILIIILNANNSDTIIMCNYMIVFLFSIYAMSTFSYDEKNKTDRYVLTFPINRKQIILSKYLLMFISIFLGTIISLIIGYTLSLVGVIKTIDYNTYLSMILGLFYALSLMHSIQIPCIYKYGAEKGKLQIYIIMLVIVLLTGLLYVIFPNMNLNFLDSISSFIPFIIIAIIIINYYVSYKISIKIFNKKEF